MNISWEYSNRINSLFNKYKLLFPIELEDFTYNKKLNSEELAIIILELQSIVELSSVEYFLTSSIYDALLIRSV